MYSHCQALVRVRTELGQLYIYCQGMPPTMSCMPLVAIQPPPPEWKLGESSSGRQQSRTRSSFEFDSMFLHCMWTWLVNGFCLLWELVQFSQSHCFWCLCGITFELKRLPGTALILVHAFCYSMTYLCGETLQKGWIYGWRKSWHFDFWLH